MSTDTVSADLADAQAAMLRQLSERAAHDPLAGLLLARLQTAETESEPQPVDVLERRFDAALRANQQLREALVAANEMTAWIARLVGACPGCWGLVENCPDCSGHGGPGHDRPAIGDLVNWISPALRRAGLTLARRSEEHPEVVRHLSSLDTTTPKKQEMS